MMHLWPLNKIPKPQVLQQLLPAGSISSGSKYWQDVLRESHYELHMHTKERFTGINHNI